MDEYDASQDRVRNQGFSAQFIKIRETVWTGDELEQDLITMPVVVMVCAN